MLNKEKIVELKDFCDNFGHVGDYGLFYIQRSTGKFWAVLGDADGSPNEQFPHLTSFEDLESICEKLNVELEVCDEWDPSNQNPDDFVLISRGTECYENWDAIYSINKKKLDKSSKIIFEHYLESLN